MRTTGRFKKPVPRHPADGGPRDEMEPLRAWLDGPRRVPSVPVTSARIVPTPFRRSLAARLRQVVGL